MSRNVAKPLSGLLPIPWRERDVPAGLAEPQGPDDVEIAGSTKIEWQKAMAMLQVPVHSDESKRAACGIAVSG